MAKGKYEKWVEPENITLITGWAKSGLTDEQIAQNIGITRSTLSEWKNKYPQIGNAIKKGKEVVDFEVENALLKRALGYRYKEVIKERLYNRDKGKYEMVVTKEIEREVYPDTVAQMHWLRNRKPELWREIQSGKQDEEVIRIIDDI